MGILRITPLFILEDSFMNEGLWEYSHGFPALGFFFFNQSSPLSLFLVITLMLHLKH